MRIGRIVYGACALVITTGYAVAAIFMANNTGIVSEGPLSLDQPALTQPLPGGVSLIAATKPCTSGLQEDGWTTKVVGGQIDGRSYYACYLLDTNYGTNIVDAAVTGAGDGLPVDDPAVLRKSGAWKHLALYFSQYHEADILTGAKQIGPILPLIAVFFAFYWWRALPSDPSPRPPLARRTHVLAGAIAVAILIGGPIAIVILVGLLIAQARRPAGPPLILGAKGPAKVPAKVPAKGGGVRRLGVGHQRSSVVARRHGGGRAGVPGAVVRPQWPMVWSNLHLARSVQGRHHHLGGLRDVVPR